MVINSLVLDVDVFDSVLLFIVYLLVLLILHTMYPLSSIVTSHVSRPSEDFDAPLRSLVEIEMQVLTMGCNFGGDSVWSFLL